MERFILAAARPAPFKAPFSNVPLSFRTSVEILYFSTQKITERHLENFRHANRAGVAQASF